MPIKPPAKNTVKRVLLALLFLILALPGLDAAAEPAVTCHCFRDRTYNPADRFASDDYLLTTVFNSLTAEYFSVPKRQIVMLKMKGGKSNDDLLIGLYISRYTGLEVSDLLEKKDNGQWRQVLSEIPLPDAFRVDPLYKNLLAGIPAAQAAVEITEKMLATRFGVTPDILTALSKQGNSLREIGLILTLAEHLKTEPEIISSLYRKKGLSWSEIAHNFGLQPADVGKLAGGPDGNR